jgi:hypothetical protein
MVDGPIQMKLLIRGGSVAAGHGVKKCYTDILEESLKPLPFAHYPFFLFSLAMFLQICKKAPVALRLETLRGIQ